MSADVHLGDHTVRGAADNAAGSYLESALLTRTSNASQLFRVALTCIQAILV